MTDRQPRQRWWIALLYCLSAVLAQGIHTHHAPSGLASTAGPSHCGEGDAGAYHDGGAAVAQDSNGCPSCEFSLAHQATLTDRVVEPEPAPLPHIPIPAPTDRDSSPVAPRGRSPPVA